MSQMNPKEVFHNTAYSVQLPYIAGLSLKRKCIICYLIKPEVQQHEVKSDTRNIKEKKSYAGRQGKVITQNLSKLKRRKNSI